MSSSSEQRAAKTRREWLRIDHPELICPRCGHFIPNDETPGKYCGAVSRRDNLTEICSACGMREAFEDMGIEYYLGKPYWKESE